MKERLLSLCSPCPEGFNLCREFHAPSFRKSPFALYSPSSAAAKEFLGQHLPKLAGIILLPGDRYSFKEVTPLISQLVIPPAMLGCLADFALHQLAQLNKYIDCDERCTFLTRENGRFELNNQRAAEEFGRFRTSLLHEIEERREAEQQLSESERKFRAIFDQTYQFIGLLTLDGTVIEANKTSLDFSGTIENIIGKPFWETAWWSHSGRLQKQLRNAIQKAAKGEFVRFEATHPTPDGNLRYFDFSLKPVRDEAGKVVLLIPEARDFTERKRAEDEIRRDKALLRCLIDSVGDLIFIKDTNGVYQACNKAAEDFIGLPEAEQIGKTDFDLFDLAFAEKIRQSDQRILASGKESRSEEWATGQSGEPRIFDTIKAPYCGPDGKQLGLVGIARDITEKKQAAEALRENEELFHTLCDSAPIGIFKTDPEGNNTYCSPGWEKITGMAASDGLGSGWVAGIHSEDLEDHKRTWDAAVAAGQTYAHEHRRVTRQGTTIWVRTLVSPLLTLDRRIAGYVGTMDDISELRKARRDRLRRQKLESLGALAGGIAHDFNNILMIILGNISMVHLQLNDLPLESVNEQLKNAEQATVRARDLAQQLLTFAKGGDPVKKGIDLCGLLKESTGFALHGSNVRSEFSLANNLWAVKADEGQISQVVQNLVLNAIQAMPEGGIVSIRAENTFAQKEKYVKISVEDTGTGISKDHLQRIFDPYFTTKHQGSGLGLAICYSIITKHGGEIKVRSTLGKGTTFHFTLPASDQKSQPEASPRKKVSQGSGRVLVMDDEKDIRALLHTMLERLGYSVESVENGTEAVNLYQKRKDEGMPFSAVILDLTIPGGVGGKETMEQLRRIDPAVKAIVSSGYSNDPILANFRDYGFSAVLAKPFRFSKISSVLQELQSE